MTDDAKPLGHGPRRRWAMIVLLLVVLLALFLSGVLWDGHLELHRPLSLTRPLTFQIDRGERLQGVVRQLRKRDVFDSWRQAMDLRVYARLSGQARSIKAGEYQLHPGETPLQMLDQLLAGQVVLHALTLIEGWRFRQAWTAIASDPDLKHTIPRDATDTAIMAAIGHPGLPAEGRFFPDTYNFPKGETDVAFLRRAFDEMQHRLQAIWANRAANLPLKTPTDALILASLIEKETANPAERPEIAGVFVRRLEIGMRLQTDPSVIYGLGSAYHGKLYAKDLTHDTPYNTYTRAGLPPTPICLPGEASLQAAVHPAPGKALYFVSKGDGTHAFADTLQQQDANVRRYQLDNK